MTIKEVEQCLNVPRATIRFYRNRCCDTDLLYLKEISECEEKEGTIVDDGRHCCYIGGSVGDS